MQNAGYAVSVRIFGLLELEVRGRRFGPRDLGGAKPKQLLELLLLHRGQTLSKDRLADELWGEKLPQRVAATIESYVSQLRRLLDVEPGLGRQVIVTDHGGYRLAGGELSVDADRFDALVRRAASAGLVERRAVLEAATALARGELFADEPDAAWVQPPREHYRAGRVQALIHLAECCLELADHPAAIAAAARVLALEPTSERAARVAMRAHHALGDRDEALRVHARCRAALADALGVDPGSRTAELHVAILRGEDPTALLRRTDGPARTAPRGAALPVRYADCGGARIAYQVVGRGPVDLVFVPSFVTNLGATWDDPTYAAFLKHLATMSRLILFDKRGTGLSDPALDLPSTRERADELIAVLDAAGSQRAVLFGVCGGGSVCVQAAVDYPDRTAGLVLHGSSARLIRTDDYPWGWSPEQHERFLAAFEQAWLTGGRPERRNPGLAANPRYRDWFARYVRLAASPFTARRIADMNASIDIRSLLPKVRTQCLVITRREDVWLSADNSRYLARHIDGAQLLELPGVDHDPWVGETEPVLAAVTEFLGRVADQAGLVAQNT
ncbi:MAG TPA: alpha/beta fold hydrolase [Pseudonocardiaceae bacterium]|nr:alpha/beta fold hydrolase [Pseudonocardiaceae bacterium]